MAAIVDEIKCEYCNTICKSKKTLHGHQKNSNKCKEHQTLSINDNIQ